MSPEIVHAIQRPMEIQSLGGRSGELAIVALKKARQKRIGGFTVADARQPQLLDQPVLQGRMSAFHPPLGLAGVGTQDLDVEVRQGAAELGHAVASCRILLADPEDRMLVGVERDRFAVRLQIAPEHLKVREGAL
jgi:hypothetical protein